MSAGQTLLFNLWLWQAPTPDPQAAPPAPEGSVNWVIRFWNHYLNQKLEIGDTLKISASGTGGAGSVGGADAAVQSLVMASADA